MLSPKPRALKLPQLGISTVTVPIDIICCIEISLSMLLSPLCLPPESQALKHPEPFPSNAQSRHQTPRLPPGPLPKGLLLIAVLRLTV